MPEFVSREKINKRVIYDALVYFFGFSYLEKSFTKVFANLTTLK
jgi:hypothetical protein